MRVETWSIPCFLKNSDMRVGNQATGEPSGIMASTWRMTQRRVGGIPFHILGLLDLGLGVRDLRDERFGAALGDLRPFAERAEQQIEIAVDEAEKEQDPKDDFLNFFFAEFHFFLRGAGVAGFSRCEIGR